MNQQQDGAPAEPKASGYSWYVLTVLVVVYILNFIDRQIVSILAVDIKRDLGLTDADMGFLGGAALRCSMPCSAFRSGVWRTTGTGSGC